MRVVRAVLLPFAVLLQLHVFPDTSFEGGALLFLFSACLLIWSMCSPISIPKAEQSAYNVIYPFSKDVLKKIEVGAKSNTSSASSTTNGGNGLIYSRWITSVTWTAPSELSLSSQCTSRKFKPSSGFLQIAKNRKDQQRKLDSYVLGILLGVGILIGTLLKVSNMSLTYYSRSLKIHCVRT